MYHTDVNIDFETDSTAEEHSESPPTTDERPWKIDSIKKENFATWNTPVNKCRMTGVVKHIILVRIHCHPETKPGIFFPPRKNIHSLSLSDITDKAVQSLLLINSIYYIYHIYIFQTLTCLAL